MSEWLRRCWVATRRCGDLQAAGLDAAAQSTVGCAKSTVHGCWGLSQVASIRPMALEALAAEVRAVLGEDGRIAVGGGKDHEGRLACVDRLGEQRCESRCAGDHDDRPAIPSITITARAGPPRRIRRFLRLVSHRPERATGFHGMSGNRG